MSVHQNVLTFLSEIITEDETWVYAYNPDKSAVLSVGNPFISTRVESQTGSLKCQGVYIYIDRMFHMVTYDVYGRLAGSNSHENAMLMNGCCLITILPLTPPFLHKDTWSKVRWKWFPHTVLSRSGSQ
jgi:hypothetical protein